MSLVNYDLSSDSEDSDANDESKNSNDSDNINQEYRKVIYVSSQDIFKHDKETKDPTDDGPTEEGPAAEEEPTEEEPTEKGPTEPTDRGTAEEDPTEEEDHTETDPTEKYAAEENPTQEIEVIEYTSEDDVEINVNLSFDLYDNEGQKDKTDLESISSVDSIYYRHNQNGTDHVKTNGPQMSIYENNNSIIDDDADERIDDISSPRENDPTDISNPVRDNKIDDVSSPMRHVSDYSIEDILSPEGNDPIKIELEDISSEEGPEVFNNYAEITGDFNDYENISSMEEQEYVEYVEDDIENRGDLSQIYGNGSMGVCCPICNTFVNYKSNQIHGTCPTCSTIVNYNIPINEEDDIEDKEEPNKTDENESKGVCCPVCNTVVDYDINLHLDQCIKISSGEDESIVVPETTKCPACNEVVTGDINLHLDICLISVVQEDLPAWIHEYIYSSSSKTPPPHPIINQEVPSPVMDLPSPPTRPPSSPEPELPSPPTGTPGSPAGNLPSHPIYSPSMEFNTPENSAQTEGDNTAAVTPTSPIVAAVHTPPLPQGISRHTISPTPSPPTSPGLFAASPDLFARTPDQNIVVEDDTPKSKERKEDKGKVVDNSKNNDGDEDLCSLDTCLKIMDEPSTPDQQYMEDGQRMTVEREDEIEQRIVREKEEETAEKEEGIEQRIAAGIEQRIAAEKEEEMKQREEEMKQREIEQRDIMSWENTIEQEEEDTDHNVTPSVWGIYSLGQEITPNMPLCGDGSPCKKKSCRDKEIAYRSAITDLNLQLEASMAENESGKKDREKINKEKTKLAREVLTVKRKLFESEEKSSKKVKQGSSKDLEAKQGSSKNLNLDHVNSQSPLYTGSKKTQKQIQTSLKTKHRNASVLVMDREDKEYPVVEAVKKKCEDLEFPPPTKYHIQYKHGDIKTDKIWVQVEGKKKINLSQGIKCILCGNVFKVTDPENTRGVAPCRAIASDVWEEGCGKAVYGAICTPHTFHSRFTQTYSIIEDI